MTDITNQSLKEIIKHIKLKKISSLDLTQAYIKNIEGAKKLNTFVTKTFDQAFCLFRSQPNQNDYYFPDRWYLTLLFDCIIMNINQQNRVKSTIPSE